MDSGNYRELGNKYMLYRIIDVSDSSKKFLKGRAFNFRRKKMSNSNVNCKTLLKEFIEEKLHGKLDNLKNYSFFQMYDENNIKYGFNFYPEDVWLFDPDSSIIANAIYYLVWKDKLPGLSYSGSG